MFQRRILLRTGIRNTTISKGNGIRAANAALPEL
jgi:hypothetical protein